MTVTIWHTAKGTLSRAVSGLIHGIRRAQGENVRSLPRLRAMPLATFERDGLKAALRRAGLPCEDVEQSGPLFWRFDTDDDIPAGFAGLEVRGPGAVLRSLVTLPPRRGAGVGRAIVVAIEQEARLRGCDAIYLLTQEPDYFARAGYAALSRDSVPEAIRASSQFQSPSSAAAAAMVKELD
jgi:N-acetylglutamate synthase-like GNAT family acetyltransferase